MPRMKIAAVCQPEAHRPPNIVFFAATSSVWKGCGSYWRAKATMKRGL